MKTTKYFTAVQTNVYGRIIENEKVGDAVIVEAISNEEAYIKYNEIVKDYHEYCSCCGHRWNGLDSGTLTPTIFGKNAYDYEYFSVIIYHIDGTIERLRFD